MGEFYTPPPQQQERAGGSATSPAGSAVTTFLPELCAETRHMLWVQTSC